MTIVLPLIYLLPFLIYRPNLRIPASWVAGGLVFVFLVVYALPYWRDKFDEGQHWQIIQQWPVSEIMEEIFSKDSDKVLEVADSMIVIGARYQRGNYEWGIVTLYNYIIQSYVPGSLIGQEFKDSLRIGEGISFDWVEKTYGIPVAFYTAKDGYTDLFGQFSFFGALIMYMVGRGYRRISDAVKYYGDGRAIIFLCFFITFPASIAYGSITLGLVVQLPILAVMLLSYRWCVRRWVFERV